jgi:fructokinase
MLIGIDLGGTKTEIICLDSNSGDELYRRRIASPRDDYQATIDNICVLVRETEAELKKKAQAIGIGIPGTISLDTGCIKNANSTWLNGNPLARDLTERLGLPVAVDNDANCFAVSEAVDGAAKGHDVVFGVIVGTGCGAGLSYNGRAHIGINGLCGEWGHNPLPWPRIYSPDSVALQEDAARKRSNILSSIYAHKPMPSLYVSSPADNEYPGPACYCGKFGCLETWISGTGFENDYFLRSGQRLSGLEIVERIESGTDAHAVRALDIYADRLARGLAGVIDILDPDAIVLGGGMGNISALYDKLPALLEQYCFTDHLHVNVMAPLHGDSSGVRGAAWLGKSGLDKSQL